MSTRIVGKNNVHVQQLGYDPSPDDRQQINHVPVVRRKVQISLELLSVLLGSAYPASSAKEGHPC